MRKLVAALAGGLVAVIIVMIVQAIHGTPTARASASLAPNKAPSLETYRMRATSEPAITATPIEAPTVTPIRTPTVTPIEAPTVTSIETGTVTPIKAPPIETATATVTPIETATVPTVPDGALLVKKSAAKPRTKRSRRVVVDTSTPLGHLRPHKM